MANQDPTTAQQPGQAPRKKQTTIILIIAAAVLLVCICITSVAAVVYFDPFSLGLIGRLRGGYDSITAAMPADTDVYISIDMLKFLSEDTRAVFDAFAQKSGDPDVTSRDEFIQELDVRLMEDFGVTFSSDIQPWLGQYMGVGFFDFSTNAYNEPEPGGWLFAVEARSRSAADAFIQKLTNNISVETGQAVNEQEHKGTVIYKTAAANGIDQLAISRKGRRVFFSSSAEKIMQALDLSPGDTLAKHEGYNTAVEALPNTRIMTAFINESIFGTLTGLIEPDVLNSLSEPGIMQSMGVSLSLVDVGIQFDIAAAYDLDSLSEQRIAYLSSPGATGRIAEQVPSSAIGFITGHDLAYTWENFQANLRESSGASPDEFNQSMQALEDEIGINPDSDLFPLLDQEWGIAILRERDTLITDQLDIPLGLLMIAGTSSQGLLEQNVGKIVDRMSRLGLVMVDEVSAENMTYYQLQTFLFGDPLLAFGVKDTQLFLATHPMSLETAPEPSASLANTPTYQSVRESFDGSMRPILYIEMKQLLTLLPAISSDELAMLQPVQRIALAGSPLHGTVKQWTLMVVVETN